MSEKNDAFHRLAAQRVEKIEDAFRIFSNLCGPSYERSPVEVLTYVARIDTARVAMLDRFRECKWWRDQNGDSLCSSTDAAITASSGIPNSNPTTNGSDGSEIETILSCPTSTEPENSPSATTDETTEADEDRPAKRKRTIVDVLREAENDSEALAEMVAMQREVIEDMQFKLDAARGGLQWA